MSLLAFPSHPTLLRCTLPARFYYLIWLIDAHLDVAGADRAEPRAVVTDRCIACRNSSALKRAVCGRQADNRVAADNIGLT
jgi:hypothetical protein